MNNILAIVIPAYKAAFFDECLSSISRQTNHNFKLYIGNDNSTDDLEAIVNKYRSEINIEYKKFDENLGSVSLVKQWERCIQMTAGEEWIWLFSDDDTMDVNCVDTFYQEQSKGEKINVYRFNLQLISADNRIIRTSIYPRFETASDFILNKLNMKFDSAISNYIFRKEQYVKSGFREFPLAWGTDDAAVCEFTDDKNISSIPGAMVQWRISDSNISSVGNCENQKLKVHARLAFLAWLYSSDKFHKLKLSENRKLVLKWMMNSIEKEYLGFSTYEKKQLYDKTSKIVGKSARLYRAKALFTKFTNSASSAKKKLFAKKW